MHLCKVINRRHSVCGGAMKRDSQSHGDGVINQLDLIALQQALKGQIPITPGMDCNQDGVVDNKDKSCIAQQIGNYKNHGKGNGSGTGSGGTAAASTATNSLYIYFVYDEAGHLVGEYDQNGNLIAEHIWLNNRPIAVITSTGLYYVQTDQLGTPRAITNASEQLVWEWRSDPFGNGHPNTNPSGIGLFSYNLRFPGQYYDAETGHNYNYFRDYDPTTGRYIESDPIGLAGGLNTYLYGLDSPITNKDVYGLLVLLCNRKLGSPESPPIPGNSSWPLRHEYLVVNGQSFSFQPSGNELLSKGTIQKNIETANSECTKLCDDPAFDKDVLAAIVAIGRPTYCLLAIHGSAYADAGLRNCQTWTEDVLNLAKQQYKKEADADKRCKKCFAKQ